jgi:hypothetical protein
MSWTKVENGEYYDFINKEVRKDITITGTPP